MSNPIFIEKPYLILPIRCSAGGSPALPEEHFVYFFQNGKVVRYFKYSPGTWEEHTYLVSYCMAEFLGKTLDWEGEMPCFAFSDTPAEQGDAAEEKLRPRYHLTAEYGWLNDPNGLYYRDGVWHLFHQWNPFALGMGTMHWALAESTDLVHWTRRGVAIFPGGKGAAWSGSAVVDFHNTSKLGTDGKVPVCLFFTAAGRDVPGYDGDFSQCMVYQLQRGGPWVEYPNPLILHQAAENRDPRVFWYEPEQCWILVFLLNYFDPDETVMHGMLGLYRSQNLRDWEEIQKIPTVGGACLDFFELKYEDAPGESIWILLNIPNMWQGGSFDGKKFVCQTPIKPFVEVCSKEACGLRFDRESPFNLYESYPTQTFSHGPDGRRVGVLKLTREFPDAHFNSMISLPIEYSLRHNHAGETVLLKRPAREIVAQISEELPGGNALAGWIRVLFDPKKSGWVEIRRCRFCWDAELTVLDCAGHRVSPELRNKELLEMQCFIDTASLEVFVNDGEFYLPGTFVPDATGWSSTVSSSDTVEVELRAMKIDLSGNKFSKK
ncbi:MAG: glycoside hydrolase family 32 protein [Victivallaceae bacterium]|nr:glycoside hydrolase family 32 protein [Victivallaceae bacterium]